MPMSGRGMGVDSGLVSNNDDNMPIAGVYSSQPSVGMSCVSAHLEIQDTDELCSGLSIQRYL